MIHIRPLWQGTPASLTEGDVTFSAPFVIPVVTFGTETGPVFGGGGFSFGGSLQLFGEFGRMGNVLPSELQEDLDELTDFLSNETATEPLLALGGGINIAVNDTLGLDVGYRWNGIFTEDPMINASEVYGGVRINFR